MQNSDIAANPLVTVIVPTIGRPDYIVDTVRSLLRQTYSRLQILISDNAPTVATEPLLAQAGISDARVRIVTRAQRLEFSAHMNVCIAEAEGVYVMLLSDDDQISAGYVEEAVHAMEMAPDVRVCLGPQIRIGAEDRGLLAPVAQLQPQRLIDGAAFLRGSLQGTLNTGLLTFISMFARRKDVLELGGFRHYPDGSHADNFLLLGLALQGRVALLSNAMYYRVYLASFGLRTSFANLLAATTAYTRDSAERVRGSGALSASDRAALIAALQRNNSRLLLGRIRHVYARTVSPWLLPNYLWRALRFQWSSV